MSWRKILIAAIVIVIALPITFYLASEKIRSVIPTGVVKSLASIFIMPEKLDRLIPAKLPENKPIEEAHWLDQGWSDKERFWFHHASQGTSTLPVPYEWFVALEQPGIGFMGDSALLRDPDYLRQFGFLPSPRTLNTSPETLARYGYRGTSEEDPADGASAETRGRSKQFPPSLSKRLPENVDGLPVGFARTPGYPDPITGQRLKDQIGFTCAACHTGQLEYEGTSLRFDGASAMINLPEFQKALGQSIWYTRWIPFRFNRFANRVLGMKHTEEEYETLWKEFDSLYQNGSATKEREHEILFSRRLAAEERTNKIEEKRTYEDVVEGFGRLDALNRIGNHVFYKDFLYADRETMSGLKASEILKFDVEDNFARLTAPVSFPPLWDTPWFLWAQYDASILQPMIRNAGEALGVGARINLVDPGPDGKSLYRSSLDAEDLHNIEMQLAGPEHPLTASPPGFKGLVSPRWPEKYFAGDEKWKIDPEKVAKGRKLYAEMCVECHYEPVNDPDFKTATGHATDIWSPERWKPFGASRPYLDVKQKSAVDVIGTDPELSKVMSERTVTLPEFVKIDAASDLARWGCPDLPAAGNKTLFSLALMVVVDRAVGHWFDRSGATEEMREEMIGDRPNCPNPNKAPQYRARPLDGIWATPPYLHNGSVPNLWALLSPDPASERPAKFCLGSRDYDPVHVGYVTECAPGTFELDTSLPGNRNAGHEFTAPAGSLMATWKTGQLGRALSDEERWSLIEYLKTL